MSAVALDVRYGLLAALVIVAADDPDRARFENGVGFSGADGGVGHALVAAPADKWSDDMVALAAQLVVRYQGQIGAKMSPDNDAWPALLDEARRISADGVNYAARQEARDAGRQAKKAAARSDIMIEISGAKIRVVLPGYDGEVVNALKAVPGRAYAAGANLFPLSSAERLAEVLDAFGLDTSALRSIKAPSPRPDVLVNGDLIEIRFPYSVAAVAGVKSIAGARFRNVGGDKFWSVPLSRADDALAFAQIHGLSYSPDLAPAAKGAGDTRAASVAASKATAAAIEIPGLAPDITLQDFQKAGIAYALDKRRVLIADEMGLGKTPQAIATVMAAGAFPAIVIVPNTVKAQWPREIRKFAPAATVTVVNGRKPEPIRPADFIVLNYDILSGRRKDLEALGARALILDEAHAVKRRESARTKAAIKLARSLPADGLRLLLTGTPVTNRAAELVPQLTVLDRIDDFGGPHRFLNRYTIPETNRWGTTYNGARNELELHERLREICMVRRTNADPGIVEERRRNGIPDFGLPVWADVALEVGAKEMAAYREVEDDFLAWVEEMAREMALIEGASEWDADRAAAAKRAAALRAEHLTRLTALRKAAATAKLPAAFAWLDDFLDDDEAAKIVVFATHVEIVEAIATRYGDAAVKVRGGVSTDDRMRAVDAFQTDPSVRVFVGNLAAASEGITLTAAYHVAFIEMAWVPAQHDQGIGRCYGRANDPHGATGHFLLADGTVDIDMYDLVAEKRQLVNAIQDGVEAEPVESIATRLTDMLRAKREKS